jgi:hypothetical protein
MPLSELQALALLVSSATAVLLGLAHSREQRPLPWKAFREIYTSGALLVGSRRYDAPSFMVPHQAFPRPSLAPCGSTGPT